MHGQTPLMLACKAGSPGSVRALLRAGADPALFDSLSQSTCLHYAAKYGWPEVIDELLGDRTWVTAGDGRRVLLREAVMVDSQGSHKVRCARCACWAGRFGAAARPAAGGGDGVRCERSEWSA
jgi:hypothetical protein